MTLEKMSLEFQDLEIHWAGRTLRVSGAITGQERVALRAPSGVGKSTLLRAIAGILDSDFQVRGEIFLKSAEAERALMDLPPEQRQLGWVPQEPTLFPALDVLGNVTFSLRMKGVSRAEREARGLEALKEVGLAEKAHAAVETLSGGEAQRVSFLRALLSDPQVLLLDEPFSALDLSLRAELQDLVLRWHASHQKPVLFVTHDAAEAQRLGTREVMIGGDEVRF